MLLTTIYHLFIHIMLPFGTLFFIFILCTIVPHRTLMSNTHEEPTNDIVTSLPNQTIQQPEPTKQHFTSASDMAKRSNITNIYEDHQPAAIAMVKVIEHFPTKNKFVNASLLYQGQPKIISQSKYMPYMTNEINQQQLHDIIAIIRYAVKLEIPSIQITYNFPGVYNFTEQLPTNDQSALLYVQELNDLSQFIRIILTPEGLSDQTQFRPLSQYVTTHFKDESLVK